MGVQRAGSEGAVTQGAHVWGGGRFRPQPNGTILMGLPDDFLDEALKTLAPLARGTGAVRIAEARSAVGKCARISHIIPEATPFVQSMWGALSGSFKALAAGHKEAPPNMVACRRFGTAARWMQALIANRVFPLQRRVTQHTPTGLPLGPPPTLLDRPPWGPRGISLVLR